MKKFIILCGAICIFIYALSMRDAKFSIKNYAVSNHLIEKDEEYYNDIFETTKDSMSFDMITSEVRYDEEHKLYIYNGIVRNTSGHRIKNIEVTAYIYEGEDVQENIIEYKTAIIADFLNDGETAAYSFTFQYEPSQLHKFKTITHGEV